MKKDSYIPGIDMAKVLVNMNVFAIIALVSATIPALAPNLPFGAAIFVVCLALDLLRVQLFKVLRVGEICESLSSRLAARIVNATRTAH